MILGNAYPDERILAGTTEVIEQVYTPLRGVFYGSLSTVETINNTTVRSVSRYLNTDYTNFPEIDYTVPVGSRMIIFALPAKLKEHLMKYNIENNSTLIFCQTLQFNR